MKKITINYWNGGFGPREKFYQETLLINGKTITYKKEWEINKSKDENDFDSLFTNKKVDFSWEVYISDKDSIDLFNSIEKLFTRLKVIDRELVCDGDSIEVTIVNEEKVFKKSFAWCAYVEAVRKMHQLLIEVIPHELKVPEFADIFEEDEE